MSTNLHGLILVTLPETKWHSTWKMDGWNTIVSFWSPCNSTTALTHLWPSPSIHRHVPHPWCREVGLNTGMLAAKIYYPKVPKTPQKPGYFWGPYDTPPLLQLQVQSSFTLPLVRVQWWSLGLNTTMIWQCEHVKNGKNKNSTTTSGNWLLLWEWCRFSLQTTYWPLLYPSSLRSVEILLMEEIPNNHLGWMKPCEKLMGCFPYQLVQDFFHQLYATQNLVPLWHTFTVSTVSLTKAHTLNLEIS